MTLVVLGRTVAAYHVPREKLVSSPMEGEGVSFAAWPCDVYLAVIGKPSFCVAVLPQSVDGNECLGKSRHTSHSTYEKVVRFAVIVSSNDWEVAYARNLSAFALDA